MGGRRELNLQLRITVYFRFNPTRSPGGISRGIESHVAPLPPWCLFLLNQLPTRQPCGRSGKQLPLVVANPGPDHWQKLQRLDQQGFVSRVSSFRSALGSGRRVVTTGSRVLGQGGHPSTAASLTMGSGEALGR